MRVVVAGSHGLIGSALVAHLRGDGHDVVRLVRGTARAADELAWDPDHGVLDPAGLAGADAVVNLAGVNAGSRPLTPARKRAVVASRLRTTSLLATTLAAAPDGPRVLLQGSAVGAYGDRGDDELTEAEPYGSTFFADLVERWEAATAPAAAAGVRVTHLRTSIVLSPHGGALGRLLPLVRLGLGGRLGSGRQFWSWITLHDEVRAITHLLASDVPGPVNLVAGADRNADVVAALAATWHRPAVLAVPAPALRLVLGDFASEVLGSARAVPAALTASGFVPDHPDIATAAAWVWAASREH
ncbi:MAG: TIGR01777 family protein [Cellulomonas sp. 73-92]|uniref:TIGR01777 family oxidoreductase n=1 Tax=Cellulomonas sp. 73-92 TaxID=1895740 RepID=UPI00092B8811|nr:TIGR01777 family oxidoreductase [Cellulomonas sp. 73-92]OJV84438.1 MAG: TIGR01777 family protein [Cellulomonas sp. 73-92]